MRNPPTLYYGEGNPNGIVCWTRMQAEAGQELSLIVKRKELERAANDGLFVWGVGNAPNRVTHSLARNGVKVPVIFSIMKSTPKPRDRTPEGIVVWRRYVDMYGDVRALPESSLVTSRDKGVNGRSHYALICKSEASLKLDDRGPFDHHAYCNTGLARGKVGPSQVTALLERIEEPKADPGYRVNLVASLHASYWVKLVDPIRVSGRGQHELLHELTSCMARSQEWTSLVRRLRNPAVSPYGGDSEWRLPFAEA